MAATFLATRLAPQVDLYVLRRDYFEGVTLLLQDSAGKPLDLSLVTVSASIYKRPASGTPTQVTALNVEELYPYTNGQVRLWLTSAQTALVWDAANEVGQSTVALSEAFFPTAYTAAQLGTTALTQPLVWDVRIESQEKVADLISVSSGVFTTQTDHGLGATERVVFGGTSQSSINYDGTTSRIYSSLTSISYTAPYQFTISALSAVTASPLGGSVYRLKQDTVVAGNVLVSSTYSNTFP